jgi:hypothetical protein
MAKLERRSRLFVQSYRAFDNVLRKTYLNVSKENFLTSTSSKEICNFMIRNSPCDVVAHIDSKYLLDVLNRMNKLQKKSKKMNKLIKNCTIMSTFSNAGSVRTVAHSFSGWLNITFALYSVDFLIADINTKTERGGTIAVISDRDTPYYKQIEDNHIIKNNLIFKPNSYDKLKAILADPGVNGKYSNIVAAIGSNELSEFYKIIREGMFNGAVIFMEHPNPTSVATALLKNKVMLERSESIFSGLPRKGINPHEYLNTAANLLNILNSWESAMGPYYIIGVENDLHGMIKEPSDVW